MSGHYGFCFRKMCTISIISLCFMMVAPAVWAQSDEVAPLNPAFEAWRDGRVPQPKAGDHALGYVPPPLKPVMPMEEPGAKGEKALPTSYDLRTEGGVTPVKNQGPCGACWTFATFGSAESWLLKNLDETWDFSENSLKNYHGFDFGPCEGGNDQIACAFLARGDGPVLEADDPYVASDNRTSLHGDKQKQLQAMLRFPTADAMKQAIMDYGALSVSMYIDEAYLSNTDHTYYYASSGIQNHGVTFVGWDDAKVVTGGPQANPPGPGAWIVKNSWGTWWGDSGYFYISYYDGIAGVPSGGGYVFAPMVEAYTYGRIYQLDRFGMTSAMRYNSGTPETCWGANVFTAAADETLGAVAFYTYGPNSTYTVYVYDDFDGSVLSNLLSSQSGTLAEEGYHTVTLTTPAELTEGDQFTLVLRLTTPDVEWVLPLEKAITDYSSGFVCEPGSYTSADGNTWEARTDRNVCLKGLTVGVPPEPGTIEVLDGILPADDNQMAFDSQVTGVIVTKQVEIQNTDPVNPLTVSSIAIDAEGGGFGLDNLPSLPVVISGNHSVTFDVWFYSSSAGSFSGTLEIASNDELNPTVSVALSGDVTPGGLPAAGTAALVILAGAMATAAAFKHRRRP